MSAFPGLPIKRFPLPLVLLRTSAGLIKVPDNDEDLEDFDVVTSAATRLSDRQDQNPIF